MKPMIALRSAPSKPSAHEAMRVHILFDHLSSAAAAETLLAALAFEEMRIMTFAPTFMLEAANVVGPSSAADVDILAIALLAKAPVPTGLAPWLTGWLKCRGAASPGAVLVLAVDDDPADSFEPEWWRWAEQLAGEAGLEYFAGRVPAPGAQIIDV